MAKNNIDGIEGFDAGNCAGGVVQLNGDDYSSFDMSMSTENRESLNEFNREVAPPREPIEEAVLKSVYCNYRGRLTVYDVHGQKVHDLSGMITYEKYTEIERRSNSDITEFDGIDDYRRIGAELKKTVVDDKSGSMYDLGDFVFGDPIDVPPIDPFAQAVPAPPPQYHQPNHQPKINIKPKININPPPGAGGFYSQL